MLTNAATVSHDAYTEETHMVHTIIAYTIISKRHDTLKSKLCQRRRKIEIFNRDFNVESIAEC